MSNKKLPISTDFFLLFRYIVLIAIYILIMEIGLSVDSLSYGSTPEDQYNAALNCYESLKKSPERQKYRHNWLNCIQKFAAVYSEEPKHSLASSGMYRAAELYLNLYKISAIEKDKIEAIDLLNRIIKRYPLTTDKEMAEKLLSSINSGKKDLKQTIGKSSNAKEDGEKSSIDKQNNENREINNNPNVNLSINSDNKNSEGNAYITDLRYWTTPDYTRVVINVSEERRYVYQLLDEVPSMSQPKRLYLDIKRSLLGKNLPAHTRINDDLLLQARAGQRTDDTVRVVVDIKSFDSYKVFSMRDPFRVIIDVWGNKSEKNREDTVSKDEISKDQTKELKDGSEAKSLDESKTANTPVDPEKLNTDSLLNKADADVSNDVSNLPIKRSTKKSTRIYGIASTSPISSDDALNSNASSLSSSPSEVSPKISIKTATKSQSISLVEDSETSSNKSSSISSEDAKSSSKSKTSYEEPPEIASETNSEGTSHLPVKKSLKASTMVLSNATRKLLRENLAKSLEEQSKNEKDVYKKELIESTKDSTNIVSKSQKLEEKEIKESSKKAATKGTTRVVQIAPGSNVDRIKASSIAKQLALGVRTIVIDPGHGGRDPGASGYTKEVYEKDVVLSISKKLSRKIRERLSCNVIMTRSSDTYLTLEERTAIANTKSADLFISLHCNASNDSSLVGVETYYLNLATDERAINVAARENATSRKNISDLESILNDLMKNAKINESSRLSSVVQSNLYRGMAKKYSRIRNLGVKQAPFYVLLGASMPSILIETSFLSNPEECRRLTDSAYQNALCDAITDGIAKYIRETNPQRL